MTTSPACPVPATCFNNFTWIFLDAAVGAVDFFLADKQNGSLFVFVFWWWWRWSTAGAMNVACVNDQDDRRPSTTTTTSTNVHNRIDKKIVVRMMATEIQSYDTKSWVAARKYLVLSHFLDGDLLRWFVAPTNRSIRDGSACVCVCVCVSYWFVCALTPTFAQLRRTSGGCRTH